MLHDILSGESILAKISAYCLQKHNVFLKNSCSELIILNILKEKFDNHFNDQTTLRIAVKMTINILHNLLEKLFQY